MATQRACPRCGTKMLRMGQMCRTCGTVTSIERPLPETEAAAKTGGQSLTVFWIISALFMGGIMTGLYLLIPQFLK